jgi:hypothetical protein
MQKLFVDTAAWIALEVANDQHHEAAMSFRQEVGHTYRWVTTNWVIWETVTWLRFHVHHASAVRFGERIRAAERLELISVVSQQETAACVMFKRYGDKDFSFVDCASFAVMQDSGLRTAFTFNNHFRLAGFFVVPETR